MRAKSPAPNLKKSVYPAQRQQASLSDQTNDALSPAIRRLLAEHSLDPAAIKGTGVGGRLTREDIDKHLAKAPSEAKAEAKALRQHQRHSQLWAHVAKTRANDPPA